MKKVVLILAVFVIFASIASAAEIKTYSASFTMSGNNVVVQTDVIFYNKTTKSLEFSLPQDYSGLSVYLDSKPVEIIPTDNVLKIDAKQNTRVSFNYVTSEFIDKTNFLMNMKLNYDADNVLVTLTLSEGAALKKPIKQGDLTSGSIYPMPTDAKTDGRSLIFYWLETDVKKGDEISIFAQVDEGKMPWIWISVLAIVIAAFVSVIAYIWVKKPKKEVIVEKQDLVEKHLKEDEEPILNVLKLKGGSCEQGTLRIATGFAKATLSRLLTELEERNVIYKEKRGKKNLIFIKK